MRNVKLTKVSETYVMPLVIYRSDVSDNLVVIFIADEIAGIIKTASSALKYNCVKIARTLHSHATKWIAGIVATFR